MDDATLQETLLEILRTQNTLLAAVRTATASVIANRAVVLALLECERDPAAILLKLDAQMELLVTQCVQAKATTQDLAIELRPYRAALEKRIAD